MSAVLNGIAMLDVLILSLLADGAMEAFGILGFLIFAFVGLGMAALCWAAAEYLERRHGDDR